MKIVTLCVPFLLSVASGAFSQNVQDSNTIVDNLKLPEGYQTCVYGSIPHFAKAGKGKQTMIIIPGWGFDEAVFDDFTRLNRKRYTMFTITIPGFGKTGAPPLPPIGTSYGDQYWNKGVIGGLLKLIEGEGLQKPVIVGHFVQGSQLALRMAIDFPEKIGA
ncbi:MAG TPA: hypothetical protein VK508_04750 [Cyclobacteriaceae bacterium]|nr:hypothetical protein [Cyclobacteriaceae bacterium]